MLGQVHIIISVLGKLTILPFLISSFTFVRSKTWSCSIVWFHSGRIAERKSTKPTLIFNGIPQKEIYQLCGRWLSRVLSQDAEQQKGLYWILAHSSRRSQKRNSCLRELACSVQSLVTSTDMSPLEHGDKGKKPQICPKITPEPH